MPYPWIIWYLWKARNDKFFRGIDRDPLELVRYAESEFQAWYNARDSVPIPTQVQTTEETQALSLCNICMVDGSWTSTAQFSGMGWVWKDTMDCRNRTSKDQRRAETNGRGTAPIGSRCRGLSRACFFSRTVASGRGFGLSWTQAELRLRTLITDRERLKLSLIGVCKPERKQEQFRVLQD
ncbi:hypothetical protein F2Q70_00042421 [Brassica cretica]|uniref:Uncharacterized protein n=1 Tax=Brassica cretica TaxID=69181 RepID=A0A8S9KFJ2_BRACR|nr:hypothetical protein F2Q70_00042421 [Brassica cretica]